MISCWPMANFVVPDPISSPMDQRGHRSCVRARPRRWGKIEIPSDIMRHRMQSRRRRCCGRGRTRPANVVHPALLPAFPEADQRPARSPERGSSDGGWCRTSAPGACPAGTRAARVVSHRPQAVASECGQTLPPEPSNQTVLQRSLRRSTGVNALTEPVTSENWKEMNLTICLYVQQFFLIHGLLRWH